MVGVRIVTDSAADLPSEVAAEHAIEIVPLSVRFGSESSPAVGSATYYRW